MLLEKSTGYYHTLYLVGAFENLIDLCVAHELLHGIITHIAVAAEYLHGIDRQADELFDMMYEKLSKSDEFKRTGDYLTDVRRQNELRQRIEEEILSELVYV